MRRHCTAAAAASAAVTVDSAASAATARSRPASSASDWARRWPAPYYGYGPGYYYGPGDYGPAYYGTCYARERVWDPYVGHYVIERVAYAC